MKDFALESLSIKVILSGIDAADGDNPWTLCVLPWSTDL